MRKKRTSIHKKKTRRNSSKKKWIQKSIKRPGRVENYLVRTYGRKALNKDGTISMAYLNKAIEEVKADSRKNRKHLLNALYEARRLKRIKR